MSITTNLPFGAYCPPQVQLIEIYSEQCLASSCLLEDMQSNQVYDEEF